MLWHIQLPVSMCCCYDLKQQMGGGGTVTRSHVRSQQEWHCLPSRNRWSETSVSKWRQCSIFSNAVLDVQQGQCIARCTHLTSSCCPGLLCSAASLYTPCLSQSNMKFTPPLHLHNNKNTKCDESLRQSRLLKRAAGCFTASADELSAMWLAVSWSQPGAAVPTSMTIEDLKVCADTAC
jgi:hypothetical protein